MGKGQIGVVKRKSPQDTESETMMKCRDAKEEKDEMGVGME